MAMPITSSRRRFLGATLMGGMLTAAGPLRAADFFPVVETADGRLRGMMAGGIAKFLGVRYGAPTSGSNRFMPPQPVQKWAGVRDALKYSDSAPQVPGDRRHDYADLIMFENQPAGPGEDNLALNLWSPALSASAKKPVIVVLHGGGFYGGSGNAIGMDGEAMARFSDSVVISVTHRLGALGFLHLAEFADDRFASSGTVGMQDIVAALAWVRTNVQAFGGDPSRVLVYGQSGGGAKTSTLMAMPSAKGLFHRAGVMSGSALRMMPREIASANASRLLSALGIAKGDVKALQAVPWTTLLETQATLEAAARAKGEAPSSFAPVVDGSVLPRHPFSPGAPEVSRDVPLIVSTALDERSYRMANFAMTEDQLLAFARERAGDRAQEVVDMYRAESPQEKPFLLAARMDSDIWFRKSAFAQAELKARQGGGKVWSYLWTWPSPAYGGRFGAVHGIDVAPSLHSVRGALNGPSAQSVAMADRIAASWAAFAASGDPNNEYLPDWPAYEPTKRATMILSQEPEVVNDPRAQFREVWATIGATRPVTGSSASADQDG
ncbi:carboxylesterase/lipase family protein [Tsuneonella amylolytica]|uniref:carboxylesterase/lipase family protein n=1 Tax=Tsuneonella amylolytica TaxID=2338327 RepID=UPI001F373BFB|nr:carboxylesterase family protein [Tsuneonella amylolytica]